MKPFFGVDLTADKHNMQPNGAEFLVARTSSAMAQSLGRSAEKANETLERSKLPLPLRIAQLLCGFVGLMVGLGILKSLVGADGIPLRAAYQSIPALFWTAGICLLIWAVSTIIGKRRQTTVLETDESKHALSSLENTLRAVDAELSVPGDAQEADLLSFFYKTKGDDIKICTKGLQTAPFLVPVFKVFADSETLYLANTEGKYAIPLSAIRAIRTVKKRTLTVGWNKEEPFNKGTYRQFKLTRDDYGRINCRCRYIMELDRDGTTWELYIPCYELPVFERLTGKKAQP